MSRSLCSSIIALIPAAGKGLFNVNGITHLLNACDNGDLETVIELVEVWGVNVKATATFHVENVIFPRTGAFANSVRLRVVDVTPHFLVVVPRTGDLLEVLDATPLFVAAFRGHINIVRYLVGKGADVSVKTSIRYINIFAALTPLQGSVAAEEPTLEQVEIVRFLLENGSDPNVSDIFGKPMWMMRSCCPKAAITLMDFGMSVTPGTTILHHWASKFEGDDGSLLGLVQLLLEKGVDLQAKDEAGRTAIFYSAGHGYRNRLNFTYLDFLLEREEIDRMDKIEALELAGAIILNSSVQAEQVSRAFGYWRRALDLRYQEGADPILKTPMTFKKVRHVEYLSLDELEEIENNPSQHKIQALLVQLRIISVINCRFYAFKKYLGTSSFTLLHLVNNYEEMHQPFSEAVDSLFIALELILRFNSKEIDLWKCTIVIYMDLVALLKNNPAQLTQDIMKTSMQLISAVEQSHFSEFCFLRYWPRALHLDTLLKFVSILADHPGMMDKDIMDSLTQLVKQDGRNYDGLNLLLLACSKVSTEPDLLATISLLLKAKAEPNVVNARDGRGSLHVLASVIYDQQETVDSVAHKLLDAGAHLDMVDKEGRTAADVWLLVRNREENRPASRVWDHHDLPEWCLEDVPKLKCLCAKVARRCNVPNVDKLPTNLSAFVRMHSMN